MRRKEDISQGYIETQTKLAPMRALTIAVEPLGPVGAVFTAASSALSLAAVDVLGDSGEAILAEFVCSRSETRVRVNGMTD